MTPPERRRSILADAIADVGAALGASFCVAPFIAMVDQAIMENAARRNTLVGSLRASLAQLITQPATFLTKPAFMLLWGVYGGTYIAKNAITTTCDRTEATAHTRHMSTFVGVSFVNLSLNISKDSIYTKWFGTGVPRPVPAPTYLLFGMRDSLTVFASFNVALLNSSPFAICALA